MTIKSKATTKQIPQNDPLRYAGPIKIVSTPIIWWSTLGFISVFSILVWSIFGKLPVVTTGQAAFSYPFRVQPVSLPTSEVNATITSIKSSAGSLVRTDEVLARLEVPSLLVQLKTAKSNLLLANTKLKAAQEEYSLLIALGSRQSAAYQKLLEQGKKLKDKGVISTVTLYQTENTYIQSVDSLQSYINNIRIARQNVVSSEIQLQQALKSYEDSSVVKSPFDGFILNTNYTVGSAVSDEPLLNLLDISGFNPQNVPSNLREIFQNLEVSTKKRLINIKSSINTYNSQPAIPLFAIAYFDQNSGNQIAVGMEARILPDNIQPNTVGTLKGVVSSIYPIPATTKSAASILGSSSLANVLVSQNSSPIQVLISLYPDKNFVSGYQWISGKGPQEPRQIPTIGGLATVNVITENKPPIIVALPALRKAFGLPQGVN